MQARVTQSFNGMPDGGRKARKFAPGDVITGDLARTAVDNGLAIEIDEAPAAPPPKAATPAQAAPADAPKPAAKGKAKPAAPADGGAA